jgi:hypothetical protein
MLKAAAPTTIPIVGTVTIDDDENEELLSMFGSEPAWNETGGTLADDVDDDANECLGAGTDFLELMQCPPQTPATPALSPRANPTSPVAPSPCPSTIKASKASWLPPTDTCDWSSNVSTSSSPLPVPSTSAAAGSAPKIKIEPGLHDGPRASKKWGDVALKVAVHKPFAGKYNWVCTCAVCKKTSEDRLIVDICIVYGHSYKSFF